MKEKDKVRKMSLEEMERLDPETLEQLASDPSIPVPDQLDEQLRGLIDGLSRTEAILSSEEEDVQVLTGANTSHRHFMKIGLTAIGIAAGFLLVFGVHSLTDHYMRPADTFSDPQLAYAEVQKVFDLISEKMSPAKEGMAQLDARIQEQVELFNKK